MTKNQQFNEWLTARYCPGEVFTLAELRAALPDFAVGSIKYWCQRLTAAGTLERRKNGVYVMDPQAIPAPTAPKYTGVAKIVANDPEHRAWMAHWRRSYEQRLARLTQEHRT